jgi:uncharacterized protein DUF6980
MKYCCAMMKQSVEYSCTGHPDPFDCPDSLILFNEKAEEYGIIVHDGGTGYVVIRHCPWCGSKLTRRTGAGTKTGAQGNPR